MLHQLHSHFGIVPPLKGEYIASFVALASYGFLTSFHCSVMCGPMVSAVLASRSRIQHYELWIYNCLRISLYSFLGISLGYLTGSIEKTLDTSVPALAIIFGSVLVAAAISRMIKLPLGRLNILGQDWIGNTFKLVGDRSVPRAILAGLMTPFLPCMTLTPAFIAAAGSGDGITGGISMLGFGLGTLPAMLVGPAMVTALTDVMPRRAYVIGSNIILLLAGLLTLARAFHS